MNNNTVYICLIICTSMLHSQSLLSKDSLRFTRQDSIRGSITPERKWWDLTYYHLNIDVKPDQKYISGKNTIQYKVLDNNSLMQIDLQPPLQITKVLQYGEELSVTTDVNAHFISLKDIQPVGSIQSIDIYYEGYPKEAENAPWDGGFSWKKDANNKHFVATSCQGLGASVWWPNKDHMYDEVDSMLITITNPKGLSNVSNGRLLSRKENDNSTVTSNWFVSNPINNYGVNVNIGDYVHFSEEFEGLNGKLNIDYYVLNDHLKKAKEHFKQVPKMLKAFEHWFGPYPFYEDGYKLVEVPYLGMEHQSSITYGNQYMNGYLGMDVSRTGWGLKFDYIIIHESGHEWFANNITYKDIADLWIHESFTTYSENLYIEYYYGKAAAAEYVIGKRNGIKNNSPIIGSYNVNHEGSSDVYAKGANLLHTLRQLIKDDQKWRQILRGLNSQFYHQTVTSEDIENYIIEQSGIDLSSFFNQYLRDYRIPTFNYKIEGKQLQYKWTNTVDGFNMPILVTINGKEQWLNPISEWKSMPLELMDSIIEVDDNFYIEIKKT